MAAIAGLDVSAYKPHALHDSASAWPETNCYIDLWISILNALGLEPQAMLPFALAAECEGDQWTFIKPSLDNLWNLYGIDVQELNIWSSLEGHVREQVGRGNLPLVEVDSFYLPDTQGVSYKIEHTKSTIGINAVDFDRMTMDYFHNAGFYTLNGEDFCRVLLLDGAQGKTALPPYAEFAKLGRRIARPNAELREISVAIARRCLDRAPKSNPFTTFRERFVADAATARPDAVAYYHKYAFATIRQFGAAFQMSAAYVRWLQESADYGVSECATSFDTISESAKALLFKMARAANSGKPVQYEAAFDAMESNWQSAFDILHAQLGA